MVLSLLVEARRQLGIPGKYSHKLQMLFLKFCKNTIIFQHLLDVVQTFVMIWYD